MYRLRQFFSPPMYVLCFSCMVRGGDFTNIELLNNWEPNTIRLVLLIMLVVFSLSQLTECCISCHIPYRYFMVTAPLSSLTACLHHHPSSLSATLCKTFNSLIRTLSTLPMLQLTIISPPLPSPLVLKVFQILFIVWLVYSSCIWTVIM